MANGVNALFSGFENSYHEQLSRNVVKQYLYALGIALILSFLLIVTVVIGYIFTGMIPLRPKSVYDYLKPKFNWQELKFASLVAAPGIIVHELAHKFVAMGFGIPATFQIFWTGLGLAIFLKLISSKLSVPFRSRCSLSAGRCLSLLTSLRGLNLPLSPAGVSHLALQSSG